MADPLEFSELAAVANWMLPKVRLSKPLKATPLSSDVPVRLVPVLPLPRVTFPSNCMLVPPLATSPELAPKVDPKWTCPVTPEETVSAAPVPLPRLLTGPEKSIPPTPIPDARVRLFPLPAKLEPN